PCRLLSPWAASCCPLTIQTGECLRIGKGAPPKVIEMACWRAGRYGCDLASSSVRLVVIQPSARKRAWHFDLGGEVLARLWIPSMRSGGRADVGDRRFRIVRQGRVRAEYVVRDESTREEVARLRREGRRLVLDQSGFVGEWKRLGRNEGFGFIGADG